VWEVLNEPYRGKTREWSVSEKYGEFLRVVKEEAARVGEGQQVMRCGLVYYGDDERGNVEATRAADLLSEHVYALYNSTRRFLRHVQAIQEFLKKHGLRRDVWFTEYGKYSNDFPNFRHAGFNHYLSNGDERTATAYNVKYLTVLFSHGVSKVFFHQRTWPIGMNVKRNAVHFDMLFDYGPRPHKFFVAANAMAWLLRPGTGPGKPVSETGPLFVYSFTRPSDKLLVAWTDGESMPLSPKARQLVKRLTVYGMMGNRLEGLEAFGDEPVYLVGRPSDVDSLAALLAAEQTPRGQAGESAHRP